ncbi:hypothetical protein TEA_010091 [Camellia sinensis var. sinensis]|uniref:Retinoblastoma-associated protein A-box domain-containing protein n=1 Tax=Camellia sinensis var. sinensis TaxID=542762 RepID=A0A4S4EVA3_CAMSN|nr:hypothetical protein TEA_010091 [Camellia sinensis var. sinensis]
MKKIAYNQHLARQLLELGTPTSRLNAHLTLLLQLISTPFSVCSFELSRSGTAAAWSCEPLSQVPPLPSQTHRYRYKVPLCYMGSSISPTVPLSTGYDIVELHQTARNLLTIPTAPRTSSETSSRALTRLLCDRRVSSSVATLTRAFTRLQVCSFVCRACYRAPACAIPLPLSETNADDSSQGTGGDGFTLCQILRVEKLKYVFLNPLLISLWLSPFTVNEERTSRLLEDTSLSSSLNIPENDYADATRNKGELDERVFVKGEDSLLGSGSLSGGAMNISGAKASRTIISPLAPYCSPSASHAKAIPCGSNSKVKATPATTAMTTAKWLRTIISPLPPKPLPELERFLSSCDSDVTTGVIRRANIILEAIFPSSGLGEQCITGGLQCTSLMDRIWAEQRRLEALKVIL